MDKEHTAATVDQPRDNGGHTAPAVDEARDKDYVINDAFRVITPHENEFG